MKTKTPVVPVGSTAGSRYFIRDHRTGRLVSELNERPGWRQICTTKNPAEAASMDEATAARVCDFDFLGEPYHRGGYNGHTRAPDYERVEELNFGANAEIRNAPSGDKL